MFIELQAMAPHVLGIFMIALACIPLVFVWQDRGRRRAERARLAAKPPRSPRPGLAGGR